MDAFDFLGDQPALVIVAVVLIGGVIALVTLGGWIASSPLVLPVIVALIAAALILAALIWRRKTMCG